MGKVRKTFPTGALSVGLIYEFNPLSDLLKYTQQEIASVAWAEHTVNSRKEELFIIQ